jgi:predicted NUDIX family NTP pyrophosphohydrolase
MKQAAGTLLFRFRADSASPGLEVLLVHPSGDYNRKAPWSIPKGELDEGEDPIAAARRETREEAGVEAGELFALGHIDYTKSRKRVFCFAGRAPDGADPRCASWEVDCAEFVSLDRARKLIHRDQAPFLDRLVAKLETDRHAAS